MAVCWEFAQGRGRSRAALAFLRRSSRRDRVHDRCRVTNYSQTYQRQMEFGIRLSF
jgi:hypothetical protein